MYKQTSDTETILEEIITDGLGGTLKSFKIDDKIFDNDTWIGKAICKAITIETTDDIDLTGQEVIPKVKVELDGGTIEEIPFGTFVIDRPVNEEVKTHTTNTGYDYMIKFRIPYVHRIEKETFTAAELFTDICEQAEVEVGSLNFVNADYVILGNAYTNNETCEDVLKDLAKLAIGFAKIGRDDKCYLKTLTIGSPVDSISGMDYTEGFESYGKFGEVNSLYVGLSQVNGETSTRIDTESITENGETIIKNDDIAFLIDEHERELVIEPMWDAVKGLKYLGAKYTYKGFPYLDTGDEITLADNEDIEHTSYIFNHVFEYNGAFTGENETNVVTTIQSQYINKQNTVQGKFRRVELSVNKIDGKVGSVIEQQNELERKMTETEQTVEGFAGTISSINDLSSEIAELKANIQGLQVSVSQTGGNNIFYYAKEFWTGETTEDTPNLEAYTDTDLRNNSVSGMGYVINSGHSTQNCNVKNDTYTVSFTYKLTNPSAEAYVLFNGDRIDLTETEWTKIESTAEITTDSIVFEIISDTDEAVLLTDLMGNIGTTADTWTQNPNETRTDTVEIGKGITVKSSSMNSSLKADADGVRIINNTTNGTVSEFTDKGINTGDIDADSITVAGIIIQKVGDQTWISSIT